VAVEQSRSASKLGWPVPSNGAAVMAWCGSSSAALRLWYPWRRGSSLVRECMCVNVHGHTAANRCTRCRVTTKRWRLSAAEVDKGGAPRGGDTILRTEEHGREQPAQRWFGREARSRPSWWKTGETRQRGGGAQRRRGITRASAWTCVRERVGALIRSGWRVHDQRRAPAWHGARAPRQEGRPRRRGQGAAR
jgi:hypothetical protein